jgi:hypothetical protein
MSKTLDPQWLGSQPRSVGEIEEQLADLLRVKEKARAHGTSDFASRLTLDSLERMEAALRKELRTAARESGPGKTMLPTIQAIYDQFNPLEALDAGDPRYVDCNEVRGEQELFAELVLPLQGPAPTTLLFSGHVGDGKSTILRKLPEKLAPEKFFVAFGEADDLLPLEDLEYEDVLIGLLAIVDKIMVGLHRRSMEGDLFKECWAVICRLLGQPEDIHLQPGVPAGPFAELAATLRNASQEVRDKVRHGLRYMAKPALVEVVNEYLGHAEGLLGERTLVVVFDNFDRVPLPQLPGEVPLDQHLFVGHARQLRRINCRVVYTVRLQLARGHAETFLDEYGLLPVIVPMIPVYRRNGEEHEQGLATLRKIIAVRLQLLGTNLEEAFDDPAAVDRLCRASGGYLRRLMALVRETCYPAWASGASLPFRKKDHVDRAIEKFKDRLHRSAQKLKDALDKVAEEKSLDNLPREVQQALLREELVYEYPGDTPSTRWYGVAPLIRNSF